VSESGGRLRPCLHKSSPSKTCQLRFDLRYGKHLLLFSRGYPPQSVSTAFRVSRRPTTSGETPAPAGADLAATQSPPDHPLAQHAAHSGFARTQRASAVRCRPGSGRMTRLPPPESNRLREGRTTVRWGPSLSRDVLSVSGGRPIVGRVQVGPQPGPRNTGYPLDFQHPQCGRFFPL
jgi:hypothetical protein